MKKLCVILLLFIAGVIFAAVWFSPLSGRGEAYIYNDNAPQLAVAGVCYPSDALVRVDIDGSEEDMYKELKRLDADEVKRVEVSGRTIIYAYSPRVASLQQKLSDGRKYNIMAVYADGHIAIGTPLLSGSY